MFAARRKRLQDGDVINRLSTFCVPELDAGCSPLSSRFIPVLVFEAHSTNSSRLFRVCSGVKLDRIFLNFFHNMQGYHFEPSGCLHCRSNPIAAFTWRFTITEIRSDKDAGRQLLLEST